MKCNKKNKSYNLNSAECAEEVIQSFQENQVLIKVTSAIVYGNLFLEGIGKVIKTSPFSARLLKKRVIFINSNAKSQSSLSRFLICSEKMCTLALKSNLLMQNALTLIMLRDYITKSHYKLIINVSENKNFCEILKILLKNANIKLVNINDSNDIN